MMVIFGNPSLPPSHSIHNPFVYFILDFTDGSIYFAKEAKLERGIFFRVILILLLVAAFFGLAALAYNTGVRQGMLVGAQV